MNHWRYAFRLARRDPGYAAVATLTIALGIGATATLFSVAYGVLMKPLPWADSDRLIRATESRKGRQARLPGTMSNGAYLAWRDDRTTVVAVGGYGAVPAAMTAVAKNGAEPARVQVGRMTSSMFAVLQVRPVRGRAFVPDDEPSGGTGQMPAPRVAILSYGLWQEWFGGRDDAVGSDVRFDDQPVTVVGVMPHDFVFPNRETRAWLPMPIGGVIGDNNVRRMMIFNVMARLKPGVSPEQASAEATARARSGPDPGLAAVGLFGSSAPSDVTVVPAIKAITDDVRPAILLQFAAVALLLATAIANVPGVLKAAAGNALPFVSLGGNFAFQMPASTAPAVNVQVQTLTSIVGPDVSAIGLRLTAGRWLLESDTLTTRPVIVVNRAFAKGYLGDHPIGTRVPIPFGQGRPDADASASLTMCGNLTSPPARRQTRSCRTTRCRTGSATGRSSSSFGRGTTRWRTSQCCERPSASKIQRSRSIR